MDGNVSSPQNIIINSPISNSGINGDIPYPCGTMSSHVLSAFSLNYSELGAERCYMDVPGRSPSPNVLPLFENENMDYRKLAQAAERTDHSI